ncbi:MAG: hypothetical protein IPM16_19845 [Chloroflexi bacterium]|nr:hypothetical protein [Chloroflexota bacterium]
MLNPNAALVFEILKDRTGSKLGGTDLAALDSIVPADMNAQDMERLLSALQTSKLSSKPFKALTQVMTLAKRARDAAAVDPDKAGGTGGGAGGGVGQCVGPGEGGEEQGGEVESENDQTYDETPANSQQTEQVELGADEQPDSPNPAPKENGQAAPPQIDPDIRAFMTRALAAIEGQGLGGYAEFDGGVSYNGLSVGDVFNGMAAVQVATQVRDAEGQVTTQDIWYGGEAKFKVLAKLPNGQLDVIRSVMQAYNKYGRFVGTVAAARMTVGYRGELQLEP